MNKLIILACLTAVTACAKAPENIPAVSIGSNEYRGYSCRQLAEAEVKYTQALTNLSAAQKDAQSGDAMGVFLLGLPLSSMSGNDNETNIAVTKGHIQAIEAERARKGC